MGHADLAAVVLLAILIIAIFVLTSRIDQLNTTTQTYANSPLGRLLAG